MYIYVYKLYASIKKKRNTPVVPEGSAVFLRLFFFFFKFISLVKWRTFDNSIIRRRPADVNLCTHTQKENPKKIIPFDKRIIIFSIVVIGTFYSDGDF
jgi:hypothetical protein